VRITHVGGPTTLIEVGGWRLLTDPTFDPPGRRYSFGPGASSRKMTGPAVPADALGRIDAVLLSHDQHADNLDDAGRALLPSAGAVLTTVAAASRLGGGARGLAPWNRTVLEATGRAPLAVTATPGRHGPPLTGPIVGEVTGFAVRVGDGAVLWISGDTVLHGAVREVANRFDVDVAVVHLGAVQFPTTRSLKYTMSAADAVKLCGHLRPRAIVPVHYEGWSHFQQDRAAAQADFAAASAEVATAVRWLNPGTPTDV